MGWFGSPAGEAGLLSLKCSQGDQALASFDSEDVVKDFVAMIAWEKRLAREGPFFRELFESRRVRSVLDLACGPGRHAALFASWGLEAWGADASPAMIRLSREYAREKGVRPRFVRATYGKLRKTIHRRFDAIINIGNSLVQVGNQRELEILLREGRALLNPGGIFLSQTRNYDGYGEDFLEALPVTSRSGPGEETLYLRLHQRQGERIRFYLVKLVPQGKVWMACPRMTWFYRVTRANLARALRKAGFRRAQWFGGYDRSPFDPPSSPDLVLLARAPG